LDGFGVVFAEVGNGVAVWLKFRHEPHEFQVEFAFLFELAAGTDAVQVAVNKKAEHWGDMPAGHFLRTGF